MEPPRDSLPELSLGPSLCHIFLSLSFAFGERLPQLRHDFLLEAHPNSTVTSPNGLLRVG